MGRQLRFILLCCGLPLMSSQNFCCKTISWTGDWCHRGDCQGYGCQSEPGNVCSDIIDCLCSSDVWYKTKSFCTVLKSCAKAKEDYEMARQMVLLYTGAQADDVCVASIQRVVCSYHFPVCLSDSEDFQMICYDTCLTMKDQCNITLPYFASVGDRCHFEKIWHADAALINERAVIDGNKECTAAGSRALAGCFAASATAFTAHNESSPLVRTSVGALEVGDRVVSLGANGRPSTARVIFLHTHRRPAITVRLHLAGGSHYLELTPNHMVPVVTGPPAAFKFNPSYNTSVPLQVPHSPLRASTSTGPPPPLAAPYVLVPAGDVTEGMVVWGVAQPQAQGECSRVAGVPVPGQAGHSLDVGHRKVVTRVEAGCTTVRYFVTDSNGLVLVDYAWGSVFSTSAGPLETLPFRFLAALSPDLLQWGPVRSSLAAALESPALTNAEARVNQAADEFAQLVAQAVPLVRALFKFSEPSSVTQ